MIIGCVIFLAMMIPFFDYLLDGEGSTWDMFTGFLPLLLGICAVVIFSAFRFMTDEKTTNMNAGPVSPIPPKPVPQKIPVRPDIKKQTRFLLWIMTVIYTLAAFPNLVVSLMAFDAPGSTQNMMVIGFVVSIWLIPMFSVLGAWGLYVTENYKPARFVIFLPAGLAGLLIAYHQLMLTFS